MGLKDFFKKYKKDPNTIYMDADGNVIKHPMLHDAWQYVKTNPGKSLLTGANAAGNVAGLVDNDKILGQGLGTAAGAAIPLLLNAKFGTALSPLAITNIAMGAGNVGALFDTLRAKKEREQQEQMQTMYNTDM